MVDRELHLIYTPYGRSSFYVLVGLVLLAKGGLLFVACGILALFVGVFALLCARYAFSLIFT
jgi:hypothetical protein